MTRPIVRVDAQFFADLDAQLPETRGPNGEPSASDFLVIDLPTISAAFALADEGLLEPAEVAARAVV